MSTIKKIKISVQKKQLSKKEKRKEEQQRKMPDRSPALLVIYLCGIFGLLLALNDIFGLPTFVFAAVTGAIMLLSAALWYVYFHQNQFFIYTTVILCLILMLILIPLILQLGTGIVTMMSFGTMSANISMPQLIMIIIAVVYILFSLEFVLRHHSIIFLICAAVVMLGPLVNIRLNFVAAVFIIIFQFSFSALNMTDSSKRRIFRIPTRQKTAAASVLTVAVILLVSFAPAFVIEKIYEKDLFRQVYYADAYMQDVINNISGNIGSSFMDGTVSRGNLHQTGAKMFDFLVSKPNSQKIYLASFNGKDYDNSRWSDCLEYYYSDIYSISIYREPFTDMILNRIDADAGLSYNSDSQTDDRYIEFYERIISKAFGYDDEWNLYYLYNDRLYKYDSTKGVIEQSSASLNDIHTNILQIWVGYDESTDRVYGINENYDYYYYNEYGGITFLTDGQLPDGLNEIDYETDYIIYRFKHGYQYNGRTYHYDTDYDFYYYIDDSFNILVYPDTDAIEKGNGQLLTSSMVRQIDYNRPTIFTNYYSSDIIGDIYASYGAVQSEDKTSGGSKSNDYCIVPDAGYNSSIPAPYYSRQSRGELSQKINSLGSYSSSYLFPESVDMKDMWSNPSYEYMDAYEQYVDLYMQTIQHEYTGYNADSLPRLTQLCKENNLSSLNEVTTFILYTLQTRTSYTTTPGSVPFNKDTVEYFLFENRQGYCVHYASTAVLMYRMYGIPARYVTGYVVEPSSFSETPQDEYGPLYSLGYQYQSEVTDRSAHAWVEIFLKDYGWVPVEVTPTANGTMIASYPGYDRTEMNRIMKEHGWQFRDTSEVQNNQNNNNNFGAAFTDSGSGMIFVLLTVLTAAAASAAVIVYRRKRILKKLPDMNCRRLFDRIIRSIHFAGLLTDMNGSETDFAKRLCEIYPAITEEEAHRLVEILQTENYSEENTSDDERHLVFSIHQKLTSFLYDKIKWYKKPVYKFIKVFI